MSDTPPPPPPGRAPPPPPPGAAWPSAPPPPPPSFATPAPGAIGSPAGTNGLRKTAIILYWVTSGAMVLFAASLISRKATVDDYLAGGVPFEDVQSADDFVGGALLLVFAVALASTIVVSIWSLRVARHAQRSGAQGVSPGLACGGWYIPFANCIVPFLQLKRVAVHGGRPTRFLNTWMGLAIASLVISVILRATTGDGTLDLDVDDVSGVLSRQVAVGVVLTILTVVMAFVAMRAMKEVEGL